MHDEPIHPAVRVGHVHLRVADLDRALAFYRDALGLTVTADARAAGLPMVLLAAGDYHHHIGLNTFESAGATPPPPGHSGLYHTAFVYPDRRELGRAVARLLAHGVDIDHGSDHGGTVSLYLDDPDGNGVELYYDRPRAAWFDGQGRPVLRNDRFDPHDLLPTTPTPSPSPRSPRMTFLLPRRALAMIAPVLALLAIGAAGASAHHHSAKSEKLVVRGEGTVVDGGPCPGGVCKLSVTDGAFRGAPVGTGAYATDVDLHVAEAFPNGEGGVCAPIEARIVLGTGTPDRLVLAVEGDSCQDGAGAPTTTAFTGLGRFSIEHGTGRYKGARGRGVATFLEGADDHEHMTLIGRIVR